MTPKFELGEAVFYPSMDRIIKTMILEIAINKDGIFYNLANHGRFSDKFLFCTFEEARQEYLENTIKLHHEEVERIKSWVEK